jgi:hypothetical protein
MNDRPIAALTPEELKGGDLSRLFRQAPAIILHEDRRIRRLVESTFDWLGLGDRTTRNGQPSFASNLFDLARNHYEANMHLGDMVRFVPNSLGHIARKFVIYPSASDSSLEVVPATFCLGNQRVRVPLEVVEPSWNLMSEIFASMLPVRASNLAYGVEVDVLVYGNSSSDLRSLHSLLTDSAGFWSRLGHRVDASKEDAAGFLSRRGVRDFFGIASQIPGLRRTMAALNARMAATDAHLRHEASQVIGCTHIDETKYVTGLTGRRQNLETQFLWQGHWFSLPINDDCMVVVPSGKASAAGNVPATYHRVLVHDPSDDVGVAQQNLTLSLAVVDVPANLVAH